MLPRLAFNGIKIALSPQRTTIESFRASTFMFQDLNKWFAPKAHPAFNHPTLGSFQLDDGIWTSRIHDIELSLAGNESAPNEALLVAASALLDQFSKVKETALVFLVSQDEAPDKEDFTCYDLELLREECPNHFALRFILLGDLGGMWRVEFEDGAPLFLTRDD
jgi:hypothetical protein